MCSLELLFELLSLEELLELFSLEELFSTSEEVEEDGSLEELLMLDECSTWHEVSRRITRSNLIKFLFIKISPFIDFILI